MKKRRTVVLKAFLSRCSPEKAASLEPFLPEEERYLLSQLPSFAFTEEKPHGRLLEEVHWSWFLPTLKSYSKKEQIFFLDSLSEFPQQNLSHELNLSPPTEPITETARTFLRQILLYSLIGPDEQMIPTDYLPPSSLNALLLCEKKELIHLIDLLSLFDLAHEMRQIVETKILKKIYSFLTEEEKKFLIAITAHKEPYPVPRIGLEKWDGTEGSFRHLLHRRGLARLGAALSGQDPDLVWYICHQLDIGRGTTLYKYSAKEVMPGISEWVIRQIEDLFSKEGQQS